MKPTLLIALFCAIFPAPIFGQHGTAPNGYYPPGYAGDTWTGEVVSTDDNTREVTLVSLNKKQSETFTGVLKENIVFRTKDGSMMEVKPSGYHKGERITVFYETRTRKKDGKKVKYYEVFLVKKAS